MKNKWLKKGMLLLAVGCLTFSVTGCKGQEMLDTVLGKVHLKTPDKEKEQETKKVEEPEVPVAKPELTADLSGTVTYQTGAAAEALQVEATTTDAGVISYQWYKSLTNTNGGGTVIEGATQNTYTPPTDEAGTVYYYAVATSTIENSTNRITSETIEVIVSDNPQEGEAVEGQEQTEETNAEESKEGTEEAEKQEEKSEEQKEKESEEAKTPENKEQEKAQQ